MKNNHFLSRRGFLRLAAVVAASQILSACANSTKDGDAPKDDQAAEPKPASTQTLAAYKDECVRTDCFKGLTSILGDFRFDSYKCVHIGERAVVWVIFTAEPDKYVAEGLKIEEGIKNIETYLHRSLSDYFNQEEKVHFFYGSTQTAFTAGSRYSKPVVFMPMASDPYSFHNYVHEMTHLLTPEHGDWVSEGLAVYINDQCGGEAGFPNYGKDVDPLSIPYLDQTSIVEHIGDEAYYPTRADLRTSVGEGFYLLSGSFVKYIIGKSGIEVFMQAYSAPNMQDGLKTATQKTLPEWKSKWMDYLSGLKG